jgi:small-conductance mechanosensitive channel
MEENVQHSQLLQIDLNSHGFLREVAKWAYFLSIIGYIFIALFVVFAVFAGTIFSSLGAMGGGMSMMPGTLLTVMYLLFAVLYFFPVHYLNKFASNMKSALGHNNNEALTTSFEYLKSHYKFIGILMIVMLSIYALVFIFAIVGGIAAFAS